jgi:hypothetical protein
LQNPSEKIDFTSGEASERAALNELVGIFALATRIGWRKLGLKARLTILASLQMAQVFSDAEDEYLSKLVEDCSKNPATAHLSAESNKIMAESGAALIAFAHHVQESILSTKKGPSEDGR